VIPSTEGGWTVVEKTAADGVFLIRARATLPEPADRAQFPVAVRAAWTFGQGDQSAEAAAMVRWEDALVSAAEENGWGLLIAVVTGGTAREWLFYARERDEWALEAGLASPGAPATYRYWDDPSWKAARELAG
jgi:hypothetical protein